MDGPRVSAVFAAYLLAFINIAAFSFVAAGLIHELYPDLPPLVQLLAGAVASGTALMVTVLVVVRPLDPGRLRLLPGRETGPTVWLIIVGTLTLGQTLDSATALLGLADRGALPMIRRALEGTSGAELFLAVLIIGVVAGVAEEVFFRGYMQTGLAAHWRPSLAIGVTSFAFAVLHLEWIHATLAFGLGLWLGFVTERVGSALPAVAAHVINNTLFTLLTAAGVALQPFWPNVALGAASALVFVACAVRIGRTPRLRASGPQR